MRAWLWAQLGLGPPLLSRPEGRPGPLGSGSSPSLPALQHHLHLSLHTAHCTQARVPGAVGAEVGGGTGSEGEPHVPLHPPARRGAAGRVRPAYGALSELSRHSSPGCLSPESSRGMAVGITPPPQRHWPPRKAREDGEGRAVTWPTVREGPQLFPPPPAPPSWHPAYFDSPCFWPGLGRLCPLGCTEPPGKGCRQLQEGAGSGGGTRQEAHAY